MISLVLGNVDCVPHSWSVMQADAGSDLLCCFSRQSPCFGPALLGPLCRLWFQRQLNFQSLLCLFLLVYLMPLGSRWPPLCCLRSRHAYPESGHGRKGWSGISLPGALLLRAWAEGTVPWTRLLAVNSTLSSLPTSVSPGRKRGSCWLGKEAPPLAAGLPIGPPGRATEQPEVLSRPPIQSR